MRNRVQIVGRRGRTVDAELRQDAAEDRCELEAVGRTECDHDPGFAGQSIDDQVPVGRQRVQTGLRIDRRSDRPGEMTRQERLRSSEGRLVPVECTSVRIDRISAAVLGRLRAGLAVRREAVEARFVHPDPDREAVGREGRRVGAGEVGHLLLGDGQRQAPVERRRAARWSRRRRRARPGPVRYVAAGVTTSRSPPPASRIAVTGARSRSVAPWAAARRRCAALPLNGSARPPRACHIAGHVVVDVPLRPAMADLGGVEQLERDVLGGEAVGVVGLRDGRIGRPQVEAAGRRSRSARRPRPRPPPRSRRRAWRGARSRAGDRTAG